MLTLMISDMEQLYSSHDKQTSEIKKCIIHNEKNQLIQEYTAT